MHTMDCNRYLFARQFVGRVAQHGSHVDRDAYSGIAPDPLVLALPRGGVPIGAEVARALHAPLDVMVVRKIGQRGSRGAIARIADDVVSVRMPPPFQAVELSRPQPHADAARASARSCVARQPAPTRSSSGAG